MTKLTLHGSAEGEKLSDLIIRSGVRTDFPCAGNHTCGKCKVRASGALSPMSASEAAMLTEDEISSGVRMACFARAFGEAEVELPDESGMRIVEYGAGVASAAAPMIKEGFYGAAIDIGTTTVVCKLYDFYGKELGVESELNEQRPFGADVISRINYGIHHGNEPLHRAITDQLEAMLGKLAVRAGIPREKITSAVVTGNTTMLHFFAGLDPRGIGFVPFIPESLFGCRMNGPLEGVDAYVPPCVSAYVGADLVCCLLASGMCGRNGTSLIIDIGTNGEMALFKDGIAYCCSTAAGPAFEGAGISCGMNAADGAVSHVRLTEGKPVYDTIGNMPAAGLCGSGVVDAVSVMLEGGALTSTGRIKRDCVLASLIDEDEEFFTLPHSSVRVSQEDVRKLQMAKAAICAGILTLSEKCGITPEKAEVLYLCGGFGSFLDLHAAENVGLLPAGSAERTVILGNGAVSGAASLLLDVSNINKVNAILAKCRYTELSNDDKFMDHYIGAMGFGHGEDEEDE